MPVLMSLQGLVHMLGRLPPTPGLATAYHTRGCCLLRQGALHACARHSSLPALYAQSLDASWAQGSMGAPAPAPAQVGQALRQRSLFLYLGHGAGEDLVKAKSLAKQGGPCAACILMGCSSGRLGSRDGMLPRGYDAQGPALAYLLAGEALAWRLCGCCGQQWELPMHGVSGPQGSRTGQWGRVCWPPSTPSTLPL